MTELRAGQHPVPLDELHERQGPEWLRQHLADDHDRPVRSRNPEVAKYLHRQAHEGQS